MPPGGVPAAFLEPVPDALRSLVARFARWRGPFAAAAAGASATRLEPAVAEAELVALERAGPARARRAAARAAADANGATSRCCGASAARPSPACGARSRPSSSPRWRASRSPGTASGAAAAAASSACARCSSRCSGCRSRPRCGSARCCRCAWTTGPSCSTSSARAARSCGSAPTPGASRSPSARMPRCSARRRARRLRPPIRPPRPCAARSLGARHLAELVAETGLAESEVDRGALAPGRLRRGDERRLGAAAPDAPGGGAAHAHAARGHAPAHAPPPAAARRRARALGADGAAARRRGRRGRPPPRAGRAAARAPRRARARRDRRRGRARRPGRPAARARRARDARRLAPRLPRRRPRRRSARPARRDRAPARAARPAAGRARASRCAASDPANPYGIALRWPAQAAGRASRAAGALVVLRNGEPLAFVERGGQARCSRCSRSSEADWQAVAGALADRRARGPRRHAAARAHRRRAGARRRQRRGLHRRGLRRRAAPPDAAREALALPEGHTLHLAALRLAPLVGERVAARSHARAGAARPRQPRSTAACSSAVRARGKHLLLQFDDGRCLHSHLRMTGAWHVYRAGERVAAQPSRARGSC